MDFRPPNAFGIDQSNSKSDINTYVFSMEEERPPGSFLEQLTQAHEEVIQEFKRQWETLTSNNGPSMIESFKGFLHAVDWKEWWIICILVFHMFLLVSVVAWRKKHAFQNMVFFSSMSIIYNADKLNRIAAQYWKAFSRQNYFQENGVFISAVVSAPLLLTMFIILLNYVLQSIDSLVEMKRRELLYKARQQHHRENKGTAGTLGKNTKGQGKKTR